METLAVVNGVGVFVLLLKNTLDMRKHRLERKKLQQEITKLDQEIRNLTDGRALISNATKEELQRFVIDPFAEALERTAARLHDSLNETSSAFHKSMEQMSHDAQSRIADIIPSYRHDYRTLAETYQDLRSAIDRNTMAQENMRSELLLRRLDEAAERFPERATDIKNIRQDVTALVEARKDALREGDFRLAQDLANRVDKLSMMAVPPGR